MHAREVAGVGTLDIGGGDTGIQAAEEDSKARRGSRMAGGGRRRGRVVQAVVQRVLVPQVVVGAGEKQIQRLG